MTMFGGAPVRAKSDAWFPAPLKEVSAEVERKRAFVRPISRRARREDLRDSGSLSIFRRCRNFESEIAEERRWRAGGGGKRERVMAYKDILVYLDATDAAQDRLRLAVAMAQAHGARLTGVDASSEAALGGAWGDRASRIGPEFESAIKEAALVGRFVGARVGSAVGGEYGHCVDLIIAPRPEGEARELVRSETLDGTLLASGAPLLTLPNDWKLSAVGENIVIAWNASREAIHAVHDAMPLLVKAKKVTIFTFSARESALHATSEMLSDHLLRHSVVAEISDWPDTGEMSALEGLFASLDTQNADLIVAGAFGHSRFFESLFGGVSTDMMRQPTAPIFVAH